MKQPSLIITIIFLLFSCTIIQKGIKASCICDKILRKEIQNYKLFVLNDSTCILRITFGNPMKKSMKCDSFIINEEFIKDFIISDVDTNILDSIIVSCFLLKNPQKSIIIIFGKDLVSLLNRYNKEANMYLIEDRNKFINYIDLFYINCMTKIFAINKKPLRYVCSYYHSINMHVFDVSKNLFYETTQGMCKVYSVRYSAKFLEFYNFLDSLVKTN